MVGGGLRIICSIAVLSSLAACGGADQAEPLSTKDYVISGQSICRDVRQQLDALGERVDGAPTAALGRAARRSAKAIGAGVARLELLPEPAHLSREADRLSHELLRQAELLDRLATAVETHDAQALRAMPARLRQSEERATVFARSVGLNSCGSRDEARRLDDDRSSASAQRVTRRELLAAKPRMEPNADDVARARSLLIRDADLFPNFGPDPAKRASPNIPRCPGLYAPDRSGTTITGVAESDFTNGGDGIASRTAVFRTDADLEAYWSATVLPEYARCLAKVWDANPQPGGRAKILQVRSFSPDVPVEHVAAYRTVVRKTRDGATVDVYRTVVFLGHGREMVNLQVLGVMHPCDCWSDLARLTSQRMLGAA